MSKGVLFEFEILPDDGEPYTLRARSRDLSKWESLPGKMPSGGTRSMAAVGKDGSMRVLEELAWVAATRQGLYEGNLASFREVNDIDVIGEDDEDSGADPTRSDR